MAMRNCDGCGRTIEQRRITITTEATDARGVDVEVSKRWILCENCAETVFTRIGEPLPWADDDYKTMVLPGDDESIGQHAGGFARRP